MLNSFGLARIKLSRLKIQFHITPWVQCKELCGLVVYEVDNRVDN